MRNLLVVGTLLVLLALVVLLRAVRDSGGPPSPSVHDRGGPVERRVSARGAALDAVRVFEPSGSEAEPDPTSDRAEGAAAPSATPRPWSPKSIALPPIADEASVRAVRLETYDPATPGPPPSPFASPKIRLAAEDTRAGLDR